MGAARKQKATRLGPATGLVNEKPMPQGMTSHMPQILFHGHYSVLSASPVGQGNTQPFEPKMPKGKGGRTQNIALPV
jgi:hypothetical protein